MDKTASESVGKVCIVCFGSGKITREFFVFVVDLNVPSGGEIGMNPTVRIDDGFLYMPAICVLGNTLYMFEGYNYEKKPVGKSMFTYELPKEGCSDLKLDKSMLREGPCMNGFKKFPRATPTPNGKILVFSSVIDTMNANEYDFELFDPVGKQWRKLPSLYPLVDRLGFDGCRIKSFTFMYDDTLFLHTDLGGGFTLRITGSGDEAWKDDAFDGDGYLPGHPGNTLVVLGKKVCMIPGVAYDIRQSVHEPNPFRSLFYTFPELSSLPGDKTYSFHCGGIVLLENSTPDCHDYNVCMLHVGIKEEAQQPELLLQVYNCNLKECDKVLSKLRKKKANEHPNWKQRKREGQDLPGTKKVMTLKILARTAPSNDTLGLRSFFSIPVCAYHRETY